MLYPEPRKDPNPVLAAIDRLHPQILVRGKGCFVWDAKGEKYLDCHLAWGSVLLGHSNEQVVRAIQQQAELGTTLGGSSSWAKDLNERIHRLVPCAGVIRFGKNGSDATLGAVRAARAHTGRNFVARCGYHGFHDWSLAGADAQLGVPSSLAANTASFEFNNLKSLTEVTTAHRDDLAAIIIDPCVDELATKVFLQKARELADRFGAVLIFDEIMSGFRVSPGGIQDVHGIQPDLVCLGKSIANGMPLSLITGKSTVMQQFSRIWYGLTFEHETVSMAAASACLAVLEEQDVATKLGDSGRFLRERYTEVAARLGLPTRLIGPPQRMLPRFQDCPEFGPGVSQHVALVERLLAQRVLLCNAVNLSYAHDQEAMEQLAKAFQVALEHVAVQSTGAPTTRRARAPLHARIELEATPLATQTNAVISFSLVVANSGASSWKIGTAEKGTVNLGFHLLNQDKESLERDYHRQQFSRAMVTAGGAGQVGNELLPGEVVEVPCRLQAPDVPGAFYLEIDCVSEGVCWFKDAGSESRLLPLSVSQAPAHSAAPDPRHAR